VTEEERDARVDVEERDNRSAVVRPRLGYAIIDERWKTRDGVTRGDNKRARIEEEAPEVSTSNSILEKPTIRKAVAFSQQLAKKEPIENTTPKTANAPNVPRQTALAMDAGNYEVLRSSKLDYPIVACQERAVG
jgi:hypothetical protein